MVSRGVKFFVVKNDSGKVMIVVLNVFRKVIRMVLLIVQVMLL